jgi:hypothetical protein
MDRSVTTPFNGKLRFFRETGKEIEGFSGKLRFFREMGREAETL